MALMATIMASLAGILLGLDIIIISNKENHDNDKK